MKLAQEIREKIESWLTDEPGHSIKDLALKAQVHYSTVRRILQNETIPSYSTLASIISIVDKNADLRYLLSLQFPKLTDIVSTFRQTVLTEPQFNGLDSLSLHLFSFLTNYRDSNEEEIKKEFGNAGMMALKTLIDKELVEMDQGIIKPKLRDVRITGLLDTLNLIKSMVQHTNVTNIENDIGMSGVLWECISKEGYKQLIELHSKMMKEIDLIFSRNPGPIPAYSISIVNPFITLSRHDV